MKIKESLYVDKLLRKLNLRLKEFTWHYKWRTKIEIDIRRLMGTSRGYTIMSNWKHKKDMGLR